jgi:hypothetical protein
MIQIEASYSKKLGLPNFSSHSFMVTVRAEVSSLRRLETESTRLYRLLQSSVDKQVQQVGFLPDATKYGMLPEETDTQLNGAAAAPVSSEPRPNGDWSCSDKQRKLIETTTKRMQLSPADLDALARHVCELPVRQLGKGQASLLISELFAMDGRPVQRTAGRNGTKHVSVTTV